MLLMAVALLAFSVASAQTDKSSKSMKDKEKMEKKDMNKMEKKDKASMKKQERSSKMNQSGDGTTGTTTGNTYPSDPEQKGTTETSPGSAGTAAGNKTDANGAPKQ